MAEEPTLGIPLERRPLAGVGECPAADLLALGGACATVGYRLLRSLPCYPFHRNRRALPMPAMNDGPRHGGRPRVLSAG